MKYYLVYSELSQQPDSAHEIHDVMCANAMANLGYETILTYPDNPQSNLNLGSLLFPFHLQKPTNNFIEFYDIQDRLNILPLLIPNVIRKGINRFNLSSLVCKYYLPLHLKNKLKAVHTRNWNFAKAAVKNNIPTIFERHYFAENKFDQEIVNHPYFRVCISQSEVTRQSIIEAGMPPEKAIWLHNGFNQTFLERHLEDAETWRKQLLKNNREKLIVYSGALYPFKGIDLLIDVAKLLPNIQFAITGGTEEQVQQYQALANNKQVDNITFLGWIIPRSRLISLFQAADILAHPHLSGKSANFTNPVKFFQYLASGTPIVATEIPPLMSFKQTVPIAVWCPPDDPSIFAQSIEKALEIYPRKSIGYQENIKYSQEYSWEKRAEKIIKYLPELMV
ncbi:putative Glycosyl transferase, group 1 [Crocosphaera subtropica ATCC 51142]|uniref:Glycosyl transferase, group 1 n=1 Tax=Crocosphaera subtropica (strain ATCC 51142 / BH68) TaxID=43989 RepID=B1X1R2_CROS5|nr:glycosyltransferase [Crocosphaera subtropica]ACB53092.1 putative Glycosyl transferase, group 1 [Crocosphaera subtropica ATCC 51142]